MDPFKSSEITTILVVADLQKSKSFYLDKLGASLYREYGSDSVVIQFLQHWILLVTSGEPTEDKPEVHYLPPHNPNQVSHSFTIRVTNCEASYQELKVRGVEFLTPPVNRGAETRCFFQDPDGHLFEISQYKG